MNPLLRALLPLCCLLLAHCAQSPLAPGSKARDHGNIGAGEGPAWKDGHLYFTDGKHINRLRPDGRTEVFRHSVSNGLLFDREGRLVSCDYGLRRVTRTEKDGRITVLASHHQGKRFNSPNDLCMDPQGRIYFTDPRYGPRDNMEILEGGKAIEGVYRIEAPGKTTRLNLPGSERPNGIAISADGRHLYIADNNNNTRGGSRRLLRYDLNAEGLCDGGKPKVIFDWGAGRGPDGMKLAHGLIFVAAGVNERNQWEHNEFKAGCYILSLRGRLVDFVPTAPDESCNCALGGPDGKTLFITSGNHLWSIGLRR